MRLSQGFARVRDGTPIGYSVHGDPAAARAAVLVHSLAMDRHFWDPIATRLAAEGAVLAYDCRGHGASGAGGKSYSVAQFANDLADLMTELRWENALVAGASMGGCVALAFAERYPQRTAALALIDATAWYGEDAPAQWEERARGAAAARRCGRGGVPEKRKLSYARHCRPEARARGDSRSDRGPGGRGGLCDPARHGPGAARRHRGLDPGRAEERAPPDAAREGG
jgi:pimeloyl-ACP methyl ester carboxylesterase